MKIQLFCRDDDKCPSATKPYMIEIDEETVMDINNIATIFCPYCNRAMKVREHAEDGVLKRQATA